MKTIGSVFLAGLLAFPGAVLAGLLESYLADLQSLEADFEQLIRSPDGDVVERLEGRMALLRPGRFRWQIDTPYRQLIVVDGKNLWIYDPELEQASVQPAAKALAHTPAALLVGTASLEAYFEIAPARQIDSSGLEVALSPREGRDDYRELKLRFVRGELAEIDFSDALDQQVLVRFSDVRRNESSRLEPADFRLMLPDEVDVVDLSSAKPVVP